MAEVDLPLLRVVRLKGVANLTTLQAALRVEAGETETRADALLAAGDARATPRGISLTPLGRATLSAALAAERDGTDHTAILSIYERFCSINALFKSLMTDWQVKPSGGGQQPNDHSDNEYDSTIVARLIEIDRKLMPILVDATELVPRFWPYRARFADALNAIRAGDRTMMAAPIRDSYHTVWFELHEDLIDLTGSTRMAEAQAGRGD